MHTTNPTAKLGAFADTRRGSRQSRGYGAAWDRLRLTILRRDAGLCQPCHRSGRLTHGRTVDHKVPKANGGTDAPSNLQTICDACHTAKTAAEALAARGLPAPRPAPACTTTGLPIDPRHPWNQQGVGG